MAVQGTADEAFAPVREAFDENFASRGEGGAALAVVAGGSLVVDLWGGTADPAAERPWERDTLCCVYSATKGVAALCAAMLVDRGLLAYDEPIVRWWPEFGLAGKEHVTLAHLLSHQSGLAGLDAPLTLAELADPDVVAARLAEQAPLWEPGTGHGYHAVTLGLYVGELVRRVDGRTVGRFLAEEVATPLGLEAYIGVPAPARSRVAALVQASLAGAMADPDRPIVKAFMDPTSPTTKAMFLVPELAAEGAMVSDQVLSLELASAGGVSDARSLAALYGTLVGDNELCSAETLARATATAVDGEDLVLFERTAFGMGFMKPATSFFGVSPNAEAFGHPGSGGTVAFADPVAGIGFAYVTNTLHGAMGDERTTAVLDALYGCL